jgi:hypothetical protein
MINDLFIFILLPFLLILILQLNRRENVSSLFRNSKPAPWSLDFYLKQHKHHKISKDLYIFTEQPVFSKHNRITGRFDQAILHWNTQPILDAVIERKFPVHVLPSKARSDDLFQAGLYALALMDQGISTDSTRLVVIHCLQKKAMKCVRKKRSANCLKCRYSRVFSKPFKPSKIIQKLRILDEIWLAKRKPKASPSINKCRACPYKTKCKYSKAKG